MTQEQAWADLAAEFRTQVVTLLTAVTGQPAAATVGTQTAWGVPAGWTAATPAGAPAGVILGQPALPLDTRTPRSVTFNVTATGADNSYAVVGSTLDPVALPNEPKLRELVLKSSHVAATTVRLT